MFQLQRNINLQPFTTFGLPAHAAFYGKLTDEQQLLDIIRLPEFNRERVLWLGGGSNILLMADYPDLVIRMTNKGIREVARINGKVLIQAQAGENWHDFVQHTIALGLSGLENLSLIPGTVGASPVQNIGAYGVEVNERIDSVRCFDLEMAQFVELSNADCQFAYRESLFKQAGKGRYVIVSVVYALDEQFTPNLKYGDLAATVAAHCAEREITAKDVSDAVCQIRRSKLPDPAVTGNVGSFYKNPIVSAQKANELAQQFASMPCYPQADGSVKLAAGWLIEQCGLKGKIRGGAAVHEKQALVLINQNQATAADVQALSDEICQTVLARFGVQLYPEPNWLPEKR